MANVHNKLSKSLDVKKIDKLLDQWEWFLLEAFSYFVSEPLTILNGQLDLSSVSHNIQDKIKIIYIYQQKEIHHPILH